MDVFRRSRPLVAFLCLALLGASLPLPVAADGSAPERGKTERTSPAGAPAESLPSAEGEGPRASSLPSPEELDATLDQARERIKEGDYDKTIEILKATIEQARGNLASLRNAYLLLIKTYVFLGNDLRFKPQSREASNLNYQEAKKRIAECLRIKELRHTRPEPASEYPPEMLSSFAEVRSQIFGSFRVVKLEPPGATVLLDADTLRALPGDSLLGDVDLFVGPYRVRVRAKGYKDVTEEITISPSATLSQQILSYSIRFENLSSALFPAQQVVVTGVLDPDLDPSTVSLGTIAFGSDSSGSPYYLFPPPGQSGYTGSVDLRPSQNLIVNVNATLSSGTLNWYFTSVDPSGEPLPPDVGFLPPNLNPPEGEGSVLFTVQPRSGLPSGTEIANSAVLTFDDNPPMTTAVWLNTVDDSPPASHVQTLDSPQGSPTFTVSWTAEDAPSDLRDFTVCVSEDGGPYRAWRLNTTATADTFAARSDDHQPHTYAFYSVARDQVGNMEASPLDPDAQTLSTTAVEEAGPWTLALAGARPNPAVNGIHVWFTLPSRERAVLEMLDVAGRRVLRREVGSLGPGPHLVTLDPAPGLKSGLYFLRLAQGEQALRARVVLIR